MMMMMMEEWEKGFRRRRMSLVFYSLLGEATCVLRWDTGDTGVAYIL